MLKRFQPPSFNLYGSYGYTGNLIAEHSLRAGLRPILAGRDETRLRAQTERLGLDFRVIPLSDASALDDALRAAGLVVHAAGPFVHTWKPMVEACLRTGPLDAQAKAAGVMLLPGAGFDVVPSDCLAAHVKRRLPSATRLKLFILSVGGGVSRGTARSAIENMQRAGRVRREGKIVTVPPAWRVEERDFGRGPVKLVSVGWGDVSAAYHSTGIPNVEVYMHVPPAAINGLKAMRVIGPLLYNKPVKRLLQSFLRFQPEGPSEAQRTSGFSLMLAEASDGAATVTSKQRVPEGYQLTMLTTVAIARRILAGAFKPGFQTPSRAYGADYILEFEGTTREDL
ncbi:MAG: saccharopine dehydrogenase [Anaerolineae bacterium]|nr:MAG: saccharopine dehydrogenase [Anaerolineae bacterium]